MSEQIFDSYVENAFGEFKQAEFKFHQFDHNYLPIFPKQNAKVLDIGIGRGEMLSSMKRWGHDYHGIDISPSTIKYCKSIDLSCELVEDTATWLLNHENQFDVITLLDVLEHVPRDHTIDFVKALHKALKPGGKLIVQVPNLQAPDGQLQHHNDFTHVSGFIEHSLAQVLQVGGFNEFEFHAFEGFTQGNFKETIKKCLRFFFWKWVRFTRAINGNINPTILTPVFYSVAKKN
ncbi:MAG: class I SAM-dependent methyltransferase [Bacteriovoracaceae bacterium]